MEKKHSTEERKALVKRAAKMLDEHLMRPSPLKMLKMVKTYPKEMAQIIRGEVEALAQVEAAGGMTPELKEQIQNQDWYQLMLTLAEKL